MILLLGRVSSSSLIEADRRTFSGATMPGKTTKPRTGNIESVSGMDGVPAGVVPLLFSTRTAPGSPPACKALSNSALMILMVEKSKGGHCAAPHAHYRHRHHPAAARRAGTAHNRFPW